MKQFESLSEKWQEPRENGATLKDAEDFLAAFNGIPVELREEEMNYALNLIPDENVMVLAGVFLDKSQPFAVLDAIFNDVLNRDDDIKMPLIKKIHEDKTHPCWEDADWIMSL